MRRSTLFTLLIVGGSGVGAFTLSYGFLGRTPDPNRGKVPVLYATAGLKRGDPLEIGRNVDFRWVSESDVTEDAYRKDDRLLQEMQTSRFIAFQAVPRNENLRRGVAGNNPAGGLDNDLRNDPNARAYSLPTTTAGAVAGFIKPGASVDLWWSGTVGRSMKQAAHVLLSDVKVVAVDLDNQAGPQAQGREVRMITLAIDSRQIGKVSFAQSHGNITIALRGANSTATRNDIEVGWDNLFPTSPDRKPRLDPVAMSVAESKEFENDAMALLDTLEAALKSRPTHVRTDALLADADARGARLDAMDKWVMFDVKGANGKVINKVPVRSSSPVAKKNRTMLREPDLGELEAIQKYEDSHSGR